MSDFSKNIAEIVDSLRLANDAPSDEQLSHLEEVKRFALPYGGGWEAPWLLTPWVSHQWETSAGKKTRKTANGEWTGTNTTHWHVKLPDGGMLTDEKYSLLLETIKKSSFLLRQGVVQRNPPSLGKWNLFNGMMINISIWLVLNETRYLPREYGFKLLDEEAIKRIHFGYVKGGWCEVNGLIPRALSALYGAAFERPCPDYLLDRPFDLPGEVCSKIVKWLETQNAYKSDRSRGGLISREFIGNLINVSTYHVMAHRKLDMALRQFEPNLYHSHLLIPAWSTTEFPSHKTSLLKEIPNKTMSEGSLKNVSQAIKTLLSAYPHLPESVPSPALLNVNQCYLQARKLSIPGGHHAFVPIGTALDMIGEALKWVFLYGQDLVELYLTVIRRLEKKARSCGSPNPWKTSNNINAKQIMQEVEVPASLADAGFSFDTFSKSKDRSANDYVGFRDRPSLHDALEVYIGAVVVLIGFLKPSRDIEVSSLPSDCLLESSPGRYWLDSELGKRNIGTLRASTGGKPIPVILARAIQQINRLGKELGVIFGEQDEYKKSKLFYLPNSGKWGEGITPSSQGLNVYLDKFCDFIEVPLDEYGRRLYVRIHEMRKWFLLLLFWSGKYEVLDAARWIAGHVDVKHLYAYIEREFPEDQLGKLEAQCAIEYLARYDESNVIVDGEEYGLMQLYQRVLQVFEVDALSLVRESDWHHLVEELFEEEFHLEPSSVVLEDGGRKLCVAVRVGNRGGDYE